MRDESFSMVLRELAPVASWHDADRAIYAGASWLTFKVGDSVWLRLSGSANLAVFCEALKSVAENHLTSFNKGSDIYDIAEVAVGGKCVEIIIFGGRNLSSLELRFGANGFVFALDAIAELCEWLLLVGGDREALAAVNNAVRLDCEGGAATVVFCEQGGSINRLPVAQIHLVQLRQSLLKSLSYQGGGDIFVNIDTNTQVNLRTHSRLARFGVLVRGAQARIVPVSRADLFRFALQVDKAIRCGHGS